MGERINLKLAAAITGRNPMTIRAALRSGELHATKGGPRGGSKGKPAHLWDIDLDDLRPWHIAHGGKVWHAELYAPAPAVLPVPPEARLEAMGTLIDALSRRVQKLERWRRKVKRTRVKR